MSMVRIALPIGESELDRSHDCGHRVLSLLGNDREHVEKADQERVAICLDAVVTALNDMQRATARSLSSKSAVASSVSNA